MYNRYLRNTGRPVRVYEDGDARAVRTPVPSAPGPPPETRAAETTAPPHEARHDEEHGILGGLEGLDLSDAIKKLPLFGGGLQRFLSSFKLFGLDVSDLLLLLLLLFLFTESGDEEFLIILGILVFNHFKAQKA